MATPPNNPSPGSSSLPISATRPNPSIRSTSSFNSTGTVVHHRPQTNSLIPRPIDGASDRLPQETDAADETSPELREDTTSLEEPTDLQTLYEGLGGENSTQEFPLASARASSQALGRLSLGNATDGLESIFSPRNHHYGAGTWPAYGDDESARTHPRPLSFDSRASGPSQSLRELNEIGMHYLRGPMPYRSRTSRPSNGSNVAVYGMRLDRNSGYEMDDVQTNASPLRCNSGGLRRVMDSGAYARVSYDSSRSGSPPYQGTAGALSPTRSRQRDDATGNEGNMAQSGESRNAGVSREEVPTRKRFWRRLACC